MGETILRMAQPIKTLYHTTSLAMYKFCDQDSQLHNRLNDLISGNIDR